MSVDLTVSSPNEIEQCTIYLLYAVKIVHPNLVNNKIFHKFSQIYKNHSEWGREKKLHVKLQI